MKDAVKRMKRQVPDWEKMLTDPKSDKGPASRINKELLKFGINKTTKSSSGQTIEINILPENIYSGLIAT